MTSQSRLPFANRALVDMREAASILALAVLFPMALTGVMVVMSWSFTTLFTGEPWPNGDYLDAGLASLLLVVTRFVILATWWVALARKHGKAWWFGVLAALPLVGIVWALWLSAIAVRSQRPPIRLTFAATALLACVAVVSTWLLPASMAVATTNAEREQERLAAPCLPLGEARTVDDAVVDVGGIQISRGELENLTTEVTEQQQGPVAQRDTRWPSRVLDNVVRLMLLEKVARAEGASATNGEAEAALASFKEPGQTSDEFLAAVAKNGFPASTLLRYGCTSALNADLLEKVERREGETSEEALSRTMQAAATSVTGLLEEYGYWDANAVAITGNKPAEAAIATSPERAFDTKVAYSGGAIPDQEFKDSLDWNADLCVGTKDLLNKSALDRVGLYERRGDGWARVTGAKASAEVGGRCSGGQVNVKIGTTAPEPTENWNDKGWTTCRRYQVRLPETPAFRATSVDLCVSTQATTTGKEA